MYARLATEVCESPPKNFTRLDSNSTELIESEVEAGRAWEARPEIERIFSLATAGDVEGLRTCVGSYQDPERLLLMRGPCRQTTAGGMSVPGGDNCLH